MEEFRHKKSLGQNFLHDKNIINKIIASSSINEKSLIIEIGPGKGALTKELVKTKGKILAFEIDERLRPILSKIESNNLEIIYEDFLKVDLKKYIDKYDYKTIHVIANLPYYITTPIIMKIIKETNIDEMIIMVQKEVGNRFKAKPNTKEYNSLSLFLQYYFDIKEVVKVNKNSFVPKPKVDSVVIKFNKRENKKFVKNEECLFALIKDSFTHKRKNLKNNLYNYDLIKINKILETFNKDLTFRAESLSLEEFIKISNELC